MWEKKNESTTECDKSMVRCNIGIAQCDNIIVKYEKKNNCTTKCNKSTVKSDVGILPNVTIKLSNVRKK